MELQRGQKAVNVATENVMYVPKRLKVRKGEAVRLSNGRMYEVLGVNREGVVEVLKAGE